VRIKIVLEIKLKLKIDIKKNRGVVIINKEIK